MEIDFTKIWVCREATNSDYFNSRLYLCYRMPPIWDDKLKVWLKHNDGFMITLVPTDFPDVKIGECKEFKLV